MKFVDPPHPSSGHYAPAVITKAALCLYQVRVP